MLVTRAYVGAKHARVSSEIAHVVPHRCAFGGKAVDLAVLVRGAGRTTYYVVSRVLEVHFPPPRCFKESQSICLVHHRDDATADHGRVVVVCM